MQISQNLIRKFLFQTLITILISLSIANTTFANGVSDFSGVVEKISPAVVNISTTQKAKKKRHSLGNNIPDNPYELFRDLLEKEFGLPEQMRKMTSLGSGFIIASDGYIVTNYHVIDGAEEITVMIGHDTNATYKAKVVGIDQRTDLALLKIDVNHDLPYLEFGDSDAAKVGNAVIAVGNPFGLGGTVTSGIISAKARDMSRDTFDDYLQTDAAINSGNSGGPLCDGITGKVLGVNSIIVSPSGGNVGIGFAIPASLVKPVILQLKEKGSVVRGWLGVMVQPVDENIANAIGLEKPTGALIASIVNNSPASKAGFKIGDVILEFDGKLIDTTNKLPRIVCETPINKKVDIVVFRNGKKERLSVIVAKPNDEEQCYNETDTSNTQQSSDKNSKTVLGIKVSNLNDEIRRAYGIDSSSKGIVVVDIEKSSIVAFTGIRAGDVILTVNHKPTDNVDDFEKAFDNIKRKGKGSAAILISRKGVNTFIGIELK
jgi:serine protease Do